MKKLVWSVVLLASWAWGQDGRDEDKPVASEHRAGPNGLEGWTLSWKINDDGPADRYPGALVIARRGKLMRRIEGDPFVWKWMFVNGGKQVAYEVGPLHFSMTCVLLDVKSGRRLGDYDCWSPVGRKAPRWVEALEVVK